MNPNGLGYVVSVHRCTGCQELKLLIHDRSDLRKDVFNMLPSDWWEDKHAKPNGIAPVCRMCKGVIDNVSFHTANCEMRDFHNQLPGGRDDPGGPLGPTPLTRVGR
jgi:hypothetical protein